MKKNIKLLEALRKSCNLLLVVACFGSSFNDCVYAFMQQVFKFSARDNSSQPRRDESIAIHRLYCFKYVYAAYDNIGMNKSL